jgi:TPR repeat protein
MRATIAALVFAISAFAAGGTTAQTANWEIDVVREALARGDWAGAKTRLDALMQRREPRALALLGDLHYPPGGTGDFVEDPALACDLYERAADQNVAEALFGLGRCFAEGRGRPAEPVDARALFDRATQRGSTKAWCALGRMHFEGRGGPVDASTGLALCRQGASVGDGEADLEIGLRHLDGRGLPKSFSEARRWLDRAAQRGSARASRALAEAYAKGDGVPRDRAMASRFFEQAARAGDLDAAQQLVNERTGMLLNATADKRSVVDSIYWLTIISRFHADPKRRELAAFDVEDLRRRFAPYTMEADFRLEKEPFNPVTAR